MSDLSKLRQEFNVPVLGDHGIILDERIPYYHWKDLKEQADQRGFVSGFVPRETEVAILIPHPVTRKLIYKDVPFWSELSQDREELIQSLEAKIEYLEQKLENM